MVDERRRRRLVITPVRREKCARESDHFLNLFWSDIMHATPCAKWRLLSDLIVIAFFGEV